MGIDIKLIESTPQIQKKILVAIAKELNQGLKKSIKKIQHALKPVIRTAIETSPEVLSLRGGVLKFDFGLTGDPGMDIANAVANAVFVSSKPVRASAGSLVGGLKINLQPLDYTELLSLSSANQPTEKGVVLPWLDWLLNLGDSIIIADFGVEYGPHGRTGGGHMVSEERPFKVDTLYSGTAENNFVTRALERSQKKVSNVIISSIKKA